MFPEWHTKRANDFCVGSFKAQIGPECCFRFICVWFFFSQLVSSNEFHLFKSATDNNMNESTNVPDNVFRTQYTERHERNLEIHNAHTLFTLRRVKSQDLIC